MKRHRIRVKVEFEEIDSEIEAVNFEPHKIDNGCFEIDLAEETVEISVDGVSTKKQKVHRKTGSDQNEGSEKKDSSETKRVNNRIAYIEQNGRQYTWVARNYFALMRGVLAFLLNSKVCHKRLCFYVDGERSITNAITGFFSWHPQIRLIMDWYHLEHKCAELLSSALKGRKIRNEHLEQLTYVLWYGCPGKAIEYLINLPFEEKLDVIAARLVVKSLAIKGDNSDK